jgi:hypothetical protein
VVMARSWTKGQQQAWIGTEMLRIWEATLRTHPRTAGR